MKPPLSVRLAEEQGSRTAKEFGFDSLPIDPIKIAESEGIVVQAKPLTDCHGCLVRRGNSFGILHSTSLSNEGMIRFTIAHELGHYFLPEHPQALFGNADGIHRSSFGFSSNEIKEREADHFAVGLLMPGDLFLKAVRRAGQGLDAIESLKATCETSLTATAIRFARFAEDPVAIVLATGNSIDACFLSEPLRDIRELEWLRKGSRIPAGTATARMAQSPEDVQSCARKTSECSFTDWLIGAPDLDCHEEVVGLGRFGQTLTVLWSEDPISEEEEDEGEHPMDRYSRR